LIKDAVTIAVGADVEDNRAGESTLQPRMVDWGPPGDFTVRKASVGVNSVDQPARDVLDCRSGVAAVRINEILDDGLELANFLLLVRAGVGLLCPVVPEGAAVNPISCHPQRTAVGGRDARG